MHDKSRGINNNQFYHITYGYRLFPDYIEFLFTLFEIKISFIENNFHWNLHENSKNMKNLFNHVKF